MQALSLAFHDAVLTASNKVPKVFVCCTSDPPRIQVLIHLTKFAPMLGHPSHWDNQVFTFSSNVGEGNQVSLADWPENAFTQSVMVRVPNNNTVEAQWTAAGGADCMGPFEAANANMED